MYDYQKFRPAILAPEAQETLIALALKARHLCGTSTVTMGELMAQIPWVPDSWTRLAYIDRLIELGYLYEAELGPNVPTQHRRFRWREKYPC